MKKGAKIFSKIQQNMIGTITRLYDNRFAMVNVDGEEMFVSLKYWEVLEC